MPDLDLEAFRKEFEESYKEEPTEPVDPVEPTDPVDDPEEPTEPQEPKNPEEPTEPQEPEEPEEPTEPQQPKKPQSKEDNKAFADMRKQNEALKKQAAIVEKAAAKYGMTVDQYLAAVEEQEAAERAEKQGIPVEVLRRLEAAEQKADSLVVQNAQDKYMAEFRTVKEKLGITDAEADSVFKFIGENGYYNPQTRTPIISFEQAYKLANFDTLMERKLKEDNQKRLTEKQARQKNTAIPHTNASTPSSPTVEDEITDDFVEKRLRERNLLF